MDNKIRRSLVLGIAMLFLFTWSGSALAQELYFLNPQEGEQGKPVEIKLQGYFQGVPEGRVYLLTPEGEEIDLTINAEEDHFTASFIPETGGDFQVIFACDQGVLNGQHSEPKGRQKLISLAKGFIPVAGDPDIHAYDRSAGLDLEIIPRSDIGHFHVGDEFRGVLKYMGQPLANTFVYVMNPYTADSDVESIELTTNAGGEFSFVPDTAGPWMMKVGYFDGDRPGELDGQAFDGVRYSMTTVFPVHAHDDQPGFWTRSGSTLLLGGTGLLILGATIFWLLGRKADQHN